MSFEIPVDKIGEVIGPKGKVINAIQQETGADMNVDDDGTVGAVTIGAKERSVVDEARRRIELILDPPTPRSAPSTAAGSSTSPSSGPSSTSSPGATAWSTSRGSARASGSSGSKTCSTLGQEVEVLVDEIDPQGKVSLSLAGDGRLGRAFRPRRSCSRRRAGSGGDNGGGQAFRRGGALEAGAGGRTGGETGGARRRASFEDAFESELESTFGNLGPAEIAGGPPSGGGRRAPAGGRGGPGGGSGAARRRPRSGGR